MSQRRHYDAKTIAVFDVVGTYFVDIFYNHLYSKATDMVKNGTKKTITVAYKENIFNYRDGLKHHDHYVKTTLNLHEYYQQWTTYSAIVFADFQDKILSNFIPMEYYRDFSNKEKDNTLYAIIIHTVAELSNYATSHNVFSKIIDDHDNRMNVDMMQDEVVDILILQREEYYNKFLEAQNKPHAVVSKAVFKKLKREFMETSKKLADLEDEKARAINIISGLMQKLQAAEKEIKKLRMEGSVISTNLANLAKNDDNVGNSDLISSIKSADLNSAIKSADLNSALKSTATLKQQKPTSKPIELSSILSQMEDNNSDSEDEEELHRKQQEALERKRNERKNNTPIKIDIPIKNNTQLKDNTPIKTDTSADDTQIGWFDE